MSQEEKDLSTHVSLCHLRYEQLQEKIDGLEQRLSKVENNLISLKAEIQSGFNSITLQIKGENNRRAIQMIATAGTVIVALITVVGMWHSKLG